MKKLALVLAVVLMVTPAYAGWQGPKGDKGDQGDVGPAGANGDDAREPFKFGEHLNFEYGLTDSISLDSHNSYFNESREFISTVGATIKFGKK